MAQASWPVVAVHKTHRPPISVPPSSNLRTSREPEPRPKGAVAGAAGYAPFEFKTRPCPKSRVTFFSHKLSKYFLFPSFHRATAIPPLPRYSVFTRSRAIVKPKVEPMNDSHLSNQMPQVIDALSSGANLTEAAALTAVHRNTVAYWRRNSPQFQHALAHTQYDRALMFRERAEDMVPCHSFSGGRTLAQRRPWRRRPSVPAAAPTPQPRRSRSATPPPVRRFAIPPTAARPARRPERCTALRSR